TAKNYRSSRSLSRLGVQPRSGAANRTGGRTDAEGRLATTLLVLLDASSQMRCAASSLVVTRVISGFFLGLRYRVQLMPLFGSLRSDATSYRLAAPEPQLEPQQLAQEPELL